MLQRHWGCSSCVEVSLENLVLNWNNRRVPNRMVRFGADVLLDVALTCLRLVDQIHIIVVGDRLSVRGFTL